MKARSKFFLVLTVILAMFIAITAQAQDYVTDSLTPSDVTLKWATQIGEGWQKSAGTPIIVNENIVITSGNELSEVDINDGNVLRKTTMAQSHSYGYVSPTFADGKIFVPLSNGTVQAFDAETFESLWVYTSSLGGQGLTKVTYSDNMVYTAFWNAEKKDGEFVALDATTGEYKWSKVVNGGFYRAGAYVSGTEIVFGTDDGDDAISHIFSCNKKTGEVVSQIDIEGKGDIRSSVVCDSDRVYVTTKGGYLISAKLEDGILSDVKYGEIGKASTSTPVIYKGRIYIGVGDKTVSVFNADTLEKLFAIPVKAYPQCTILLSNAYEKSEGYLYLYTTYNASPGGITLIKIKPDGQSADECIVTELYDAKGHEQFCISDILCNDGDLYYKNDSGCLFALSDKECIYTSLAEEGFILPETQLKVSPKTAEFYGYTDKVEDGVSALDVLVKIHADMFGEDFTSETAQAFLSVSEEGYLSAILGMETYNFGFAVNGKTPCDTTIDTGYGYLGLTLNETKISNEDYVEFFLYRDGWSMDNYVSFYSDGKLIKSIDSDMNESITLSAKGYSVGWYGTYSDEYIENMKNPVSNAYVCIVDKETGEMNPSTYTDSSGKFTLSFEAPGEYIISLNEAEGATSIIPSWFKIKVRGIQLIANDDNSITVKSNLKESKSLSLIIAEYEDSALKSVTVIPISISAGEFSETTDENLISDNSKVFLWTADMVPICEGMIK